LLSLLFSILLGFIGCIASSKRISFYSILAYISLAGSLLSLFSEIDAPRQYVYQQIILFIILLFVARFLAVRRRWVIRLLGLYEPRLGLYDPKSLRDKYYDSLSLRWVDMEIGLLFNGAWLICYPNNYYWLIWLNLSKNLILLWSFAIARVTERTALGYAPSAFPKDDYPKTVNERTQEILDKFGPPSGPK